MLGPLVVEAQSVDDLLDQPGLVGHIVLGPLLRAHARDRVVVEGSPGLFLGVEHPRAVGTALRYTALDDLHLSESHPGMV